MIVMRTIARTIRKMSPYRMEVTLSDREKRWGEAAKRALGLGALSAVEVPPNMAGGGSGVPQIATIVENEPPFAV